jgi:hypothetical protein
MTTNSNSSLVLNLIMSTGNQTLLLSGSLLSNAATELAQTLRVDLVQLLDQPVSNLSRYGLSDLSIAIMKTNGFVVVQDLNFLQVSHLRSMGFPHEEIHLLTHICNEVRRTISVGSLSKILKNASKNITDIAASLPTKNTFIDFPNLFSAQNERHPQSCPAFFLEEERRALEALEASIQQQKPMPSPFDESKTVLGFIERAPEKSKGSDCHGTGSCKPCAWYHHVEGCRHGADCEFCHMCPNGEIKKRKKEKQKLIRTMKDVTPITTPDVHTADDTDAGGVYPEVCQPIPARSGISGWLGSIFAK